MKKPYNKELHDDIELLKTLHARKDKSGFNHLKNEIMRRHNISKATVYREMKKDTPGLYKTPRYFPPQREVTPKERALVKNLLERQFKVQDIINIMERETGENYSWDRIDKIRESIKALPLVKGEYPTGEGVVVEIPPLSPLLIKEGKNSRNIRRVVEELLEAAKMTEGETITLSFGGSEHTISRDAARDISLIITNYIDAGEQSISEINRMRLMHLVTDKIRLISLGSYASVRELKELCDMNSAISEKSAKYPMTIQELIESTG